MLEAVGDIWEYFDRGEIVVITTNGSLTLDGRAIFGWGVARQAGQPFLASCFDKRFLVISH